MNSLKIYKDDYASSTVISNLFIDEYMQDANDAELKVYLYLVRMTSANLSTSVSDMADKFNHTEKDILRALKYWEARKLIALVFNDDNALAGIRFISPVSVKPVDQRPLAPIVPLKLVQAPAAESAGAPAYKQAVPAPVQDTEVSKYPETLSYSRDQLKAFKDNPETSQIIFVAESYLRKTLAKSDIEVLYFIHFDLGFSCELIDYLLQYCIDRGKSSFAYIKKVGIDWAEVGIKTVKQAKSFASSRYEKPVYTIMNALGRNFAPTQAEAAMIIKWYKDLALPLEVIDEACKRTVLATDSHRLEYCDRILASWSSNGVKSLDDIAACDASHKKVQSQRVAQTRNSFNQISQHDYDFEELERKLISN